MNEFNYNNKNTHINNNIKNNINTHLGMLKLLMFKGI